jgi:O-antigen ligase
VNRDLLRPQNLFFGAAALVLCLAVAMLLPGRLATFSPSLIRLMPAAVAFVLVAAALAATRPLAAVGLAFSLLWFVSVQPSPSDIVFAMLIVTTFMSVRMRPRIPSFVGIPLACFVLATIISAVNANDLHRAMSFELITIYMVLLAIWCTWAFARREWLHLALKLYIVSAIISGALGPLALYTPFPGRQHLLFAGDRALGLFKDPNVYSAFLVPAAVILLDELTSARFLGWRRRTIVAAFGIVSIGVVVSYSRAAWLNLALAVTTLIAVQAVRRGGPARALKSIGVLACCGVAGYVVLAQTGSLAFLNERSHLQGYDTQRFSNQSTSLGDMFRHVLGYGPGQTEVDRPISAHSTYVRAAFEQGLPGLASLVLVLAGTLLCAILLARRREQVNGVGTAALLGIWIGQVANSFFIDTLHWRHLWIFAGLIWCSYSIASERSLQPYRRAPASIRPLPTGTGSP